MFEIRVQDRFSAAHRLPGYPGNCARMHGHNWVVTAVVRARELNDIGIALDFRTVKGALGDILETFDHRDLNEHPEFANQNPTSERIAQFVYRELAARINDGNVQVAGVEISETPGTAAGYFES